MRATNETPCPKVAVITRANAEMFLQYLGPLYFRNSSKMSLTLTASAVESLLVQTNSICLAKEVNVLVSLKADQANAMIELLGFYQNYWAENNRLAKTLDDKQRKAIQDVFLLAEELMEEFKKCIQTASKSPITDLKS